MQKGLTHASLYFLRYVWWVAFGGFQGLTPEYEVKDFKDGFRYIDFVYFTNGFRIAIEIDGFGPHWRDLTPEDFDEERMRQNHLVLDQWVILRFTYKGIVDRPRQCEQLIQQLLGKLAIQNTLDPLSLSPIEKQILHFVYHSPQAVSPAILRHALNQHRNTLARHLRSLLKKGILLPANPAQLRVNRYVMNPETQLPFTKFNAKL